MEIGIIRLPKSGKTTISNTLTRGKAETAAYAPAALVPNIGIAKVQDQRLRKLEEILQPRKVTPAEVKYVDIAAATRGFDKNVEISEHLINHLSNANALLYAARAFESENIPHIEASINPNAT